MKYDFNSSINFSNKIKMPRSKFSLSEPKKQTFKVVKKLEFTHDSKNLFNKFNKEESKIQVHIRVILLIFLICVKSF